MFTVTRTVTFEHAGVNKDTRIIPKVLRPYKPGSTVHPSRVLCCRIGGKLFLQLG